MMMRFITKLRQSEENLYTVCNILLQLLQIKVTSKSLKTSVDQHINFPSLLTIKDVLKEYGVESAALHRNENSFADFETPYIASIQKPEWGNRYFTIIRNVQNNLIEFYDPVNLNWKTEKTEAFQQWDKNIILLIEKQDINGEKDYINKRKEERKEYLVKNIPGSFLLFTVLLGVGFFLKNSWPQIPVYELLMIVLYASGIVFSFLLTWYEVDNQNPFLKEVCSGGKKINCNAVLQSKGANFYGIEWSIIGLSYFTSGLLTILIIGFNNPIILQVLGILSLLATCYIIYSVYFQYKIVKEWCLLCLGVQGVLFAQAIAVLFYFTIDKNWLTVVDLEYAISVVLLFALVTMGIIYIFPFVKKAKLGRMYELKWKRMKSNPNVFFGLLSQQTKIENYPYDMGIVLGNPEAKHEIIKVCSPYCDPCARAHPVLEEIIRKNNNVKLRIIFNTDDNKQDIKSKTVRHFMALAEIKSSQEMQHALDDWYTSESINKDYEKLTNKYPLNKELTLQGSKLSNMSKWCTEMKIWGTPTFFVNGHEIFEEYSVQDLKEVFTN